MALRRLTAGAVLVATGAGLALAAGPASLAAQRPEGARPGVVTRHGASPASAASEPANPIPPPGAEGRIEVGETMRGALEPGDLLMADSTFADVWVFAGTAGQPVTVDVRSDEFDTYLQLLDAGGAKLGDDDDSGGDLNSRLTLTLPATGEYRIVVNSAGHEPRAGRYTVSIR